MKRITKQKQPTPASDPLREYTHPQSGFGPPSHYDISRRAYEIYLNKHSQRGQCAQNWLQAESELREEHVAQHNGRR